MPNGNPVQQFTLRNGKGMLVRVMSYGAILNQLAPSKADLGIGTHDATLCSCGSRQSDYRLAKIRHGILSARKWNNLSSASALICGLTAQIVTIQI
jgi:galactose mutarotase-like enzyme